jgi:hypothetical protein
VGVRGKDREYVKRKRGGLRLRDSGRGNASFQPASRRAKMAALVWVSHRCVVPDFFYQGGRGCRPKVTNQDFKG